MRRRVPVELPMTAIRTGEPSGRTARLFEARILACQEAEVRLLTLAHDDPRTWKILDGLSSLRLWAEGKMDGQTGILAPAGCQGPSRGNLSLFGGGD